MFSEPEEAGRIAEGALMRRAAPAPVSPKGAKGP